VQKSTGRLECASCRCGVLGGASRTFSDRASGSGAHARHWAHSCRPDPSSNEPWT